jgi:hypothetical protein
MVNRDQAHDYIVRHRKRVGYLGRLSRRILELIEDDLRELSGTIRLFADLTKDELVRAIASAEYPQLNEARTAFYGKCKADDCPVTEMCGPHGRGYVFREPGKPELICPN